MFTIRYKYFDARSNQFEYHTMVAFNGKYAAQLVKFVYLLSKASTALQFEHSIAYRRFN